MLMEMYFKKEIEFQKGVEMEMVSKQVVDIKAEIVMETVKT